MCSCTRRSVLGMMAALPLVAGCRPQTEGPEEIRYGRETCAMCGMIIGDPHFAAEIRGPDSKLAKFDDVGDAVNYLHDQDWRDSPAEFWVMDYASGTKWLDARVSYYEKGVSSPMAYGFGAHEAFREGLIDYATMAKLALERGVTSRCLPGAAAPADEASKA